MDIQIAQVWEAASILLALQATSFGWRINRELAASEKGEPTWLPVADIVNLIAMCISVACAFLVPILGIWSTSGAIRSFGLVLILVVGHAVSDGRSLRALQYREAIEHVFSVARKVCGRRDGCPIHVLPARSWSEQKHGLRGLLRVPTRLLTTKPQHQQHDPQGQVGDRAQECRVGVVIQVPGALAAGGGRTRARQATTKMLKGPAEFLDYFPATTGV